MEKSILAAGYKPVLCDYALDTCKSLKQPDLSGTGITLSGALLSELHIPGIDFRMIRRCCSGCVGRQYLPM